MHKKRKKKRKEPLSPEVVLEGTARVTVKELLGLIHGVNPTGNDLDKEERDRRYGLKSQLQSRLINQYGDQLLVSSRPDQPELISLELRRFEEDACHALIHDLDDNARAWVRNQLNFQTDPQPPDGIGLSPNQGYQPAAPDQGRNGDVNALLHLGRQALHDYDYESGEQYLKRAFAVAPDRVEVVTELLDLWVNYLANYECALALYAGSGLADVSSIRVLAALAAVRAGHIETAMSFALPVADMRVSEVYLSAARHYIDLKDDQRTCHCISLLEDLDSGELRAEIHQLTERLQGLYLARLAPLEEEMTVAWENGQVAKAVELARNLHNQWPTNKKADWVCREHDKQLRAHEFAGILQHVEEAAGRGDMELECLLLGRAIQIGGNRIDLTERLTLLEDILAEEKDRVLLKRVTSMWRENQREMALQAYTDLNQPLRKKLRETIEAPHFSWLEEARSSLTGKKTKVSELIDVVLFFSDGKDAFEQGGEPSVVLSQLEPVAQRLELIDEGRRLLESLRVSASARARERARSNLEETLRLLEMGVWQEVRAILPNPQFLEEAGQILLDEATSRLAHLEKLDREKRHYDSLVELDDYQGAAASALALAALTSASASALWRTKQAEHGESLNRQWCLTGLDLQELPPCFSKIETVCMAHGHYGCMLENGRVLLISGFGSWLLIRLLTLDGLDSVILARTPLPVSFPKILTHDGVIWVTEEEGLLLELQLEPLAIRSFWDFRGSKFQQDSLEDVWFFPKERSLCMNLLRKDTFFTTCLFYDIDSKRESRRLSHVKVPSLIDGPTLHVMAAGSGKKWLQVFDTRGKGVNRFHLDHGSLADRACLHPNGKDFIFAAFFDADIDHDQAKALGFMLEVPSDECAFKPYRVEGGRADMEHNLVSCASLGLVFVFYSRNDEPEYFLLALRALENRFEQVYLVECPNLFFIKDALFERVGVVYADGLGLQRVTMLSEDPPEFVWAADEAMPRPVPYAMIPILQCGKMNGSANAHSLSLVATFFDLDINEIIGVVDRLKQVEARPVEAFAHVAALRKMSLFIEAGELEDWAVRTYPNSPRVKILRANEAAILSNWEEIDKLLRDLDDEDLDEGTQAHINHLLGMARYASGDTHGAKKLWCRVQDFDHDCPLQQLIELADATEKHKWREDEEIASLRKTLQIYEKVDDLSRKEQWQEAIDILQGMPYFQSDSNVVYRLARAYLAVEVPASGRRWLCKVLALGELCSRQALMDSDPCWILPPTIKHWKTTEIEALTLEASAWLATQ